MWTIPAGYLENGETLLEGAKREALEEACANVDILDLYTIFDLTRINQVYLIFRARLLDHDYFAGSESLEVKLFEEEKIPWDLVAFKAIKESLRLYFKDRPNGIYPLHIGQIPPP
jgi:ADP-ribose pyrophosphatase YjhB (NUDIX family)